MSKPNQSPEEEALMALLDEAYQQLMANGGELPDDLFADTDTIEQEEMVVVEEGRLFSECLLWQLQREYFERQGVNAWNKQVPYYITSNIVIAECYASIYFRFIQDQVRQHPEAKQHPFYILELGTGCGKFSFYCVKKLDQLLTQLGDDELNVTYVMTDFTNSNVEFWQNQSVLKPFVKKGLLDFAIFNMESDNQVALINHQQTISAESLVNPVMLSANYIFDSISSDVFRVDEGKLYESRAKFSAGVSNVDEAGKVLDWEKLKLDFDNVEIDPSEYYSDPVLNDILAHYRDTLTSAYFTFPTASLRALNNLRALANDKLFMIVSDKGYTTLQQIEGSNQPEIEFHGSFSIMVNLDTVGEYFKRTGGDFILQAPNNDLESGIFYSGLTLDDCGETLQAIREQYVDYSPADYFMLYSHARDNNEQIELDILTSYIKLSHYDPHMLNRIYHTVTNNMESANRNTRTALSDCMPKIESNIYFTPGGYDTYFQMAIFYHSINDFEQAIDYYKKSLQWFEPGYSVFFNLASAYNAVDNLDKAYDYIQQALSHDADSDEAKELLETIRDKKRALPISQED